MKLSVVYEGTLFHAQMIRNLLEHECIEAFLKDEITGTRGGELWSPGGGVKVIVTDNDLRKALQIVRDYEQSLLL